MIATEVAGVPYLYLGLLHLCREGITHCGLEFRNLKGQSLYERIGHLPGQVGQRQSLNSRTFLLAIKGRFCHGFHPGGS
jgi:hypothetical protein